MYFANKLLISKQKRAKTKDSLAQENYLRTLDPLHSILRTFYI